jgi:hypothetical protein
MRAIPDSGIQTASYFAFHLFFAVIIRGLRLPVTIPERDYRAEDNRKTEQDDERRDYMVAQMPACRLAMSILLPTSSWLDR